MFNSGKVKRNPRIVNFTMLDHEQELNVEMQTYTYIGSTIVQIYYTILADIVRHNAVGNQPQCDGEAYPVLSFEDEADFWNGGEDSDNSHYEVGS